MKAPARNPIHVLHVVPTLEVGGMELVLSRVVRGLSEEFRHSVICLKGEPAVAGLFDATIRIYCLRARPREPALALRLARLLRKIRPDLIHARNWGAWPDTVMARLVSRSRSPLLFGFHGLLEPGPMPLRQRMACHLLASMTTRLMTVSSASRTFLARLTGLPVTRIAVIPNGVDLQWFCARPKTASRQPNERIIIGTVGSLWPIKNHELLVAACTDLWRTGLNVELRIAGDGPLRQRLAEQAKAHGFQDRIRLVGHVDDIPSFLRELDVFVLSSNSEQHPNALLEAMACGLPCSATAVGGVPEVLADGGCGIIVPPGDRRALTAGVMQLAKDEGLRRRLGEAARRRAVECYSLRRMIDQYDQLYRSLADRTCRRSR